MYFRNSSSLDGTIPSTDEGQKADSSSLVDASEIDVKVMGQMNMGRGSGGFDPSNMPEGFDIESYTGKITLDIVEVKVSGAFSISSDSKDITLEYKNGNLVNYTEYTSEDVVVQYLYDSVRDNVYKYVKMQNYFLAI